MARVASGGELSRIHLAIRTVLLGLFAAVALVLALVGVSAVMGVAVSQRAPEIGIRMALGASGSDVVRMLLAQSMKPVVWGLVTGLAASIALTRFLSSRLFNVTPTDPATYAAVATLLSAAALAAAFVPTLRALRIDPVQTLRTDRF